VKVLPEPRSSSWHDFKGGNNLPYQPSEVCGCGDGNRRANLLGETCPAPAETVKPSLPMYMSLDMRPVRRAPWRLRGDPYTFQNGPKRAFFESEETEGLLTSRETAD
jgi:hypothetical protein